MNDIEGNLAAAEAAVELTEAEIAATELAARAPVREDSPTFTDLGVRQETVAALEAVGITRSFAIQEYAIPVAMRGTDLIGQAPTGTGKTLGFGVPLLERVLSVADGSDGIPQALVVVPTRELGLQVARDIEAAGKTRHIRVLPVYGGVAYEPQTEALKRGVARGELPFRIGRCLRVHPEQLLCDARLVALGLTCQQRHFDSSSEVPLARLERWR